MKRILSVLLVLAMLMSCAFAAEEVPGGEPDENRDGYIWIQEQEKEQIWTDDRDDEELPGNGLPAAAVTAGDPDEDDEDDPGADEPWIDEPDPDEDDEDDPADTADEDDPADGDEQPQDASLDTELTEEEEEEEEPAEPFSVRSTVAVDGKAVFTLISTVPEDVDLYLQWQYRNNGKKDWHDLDGENGTLLVISDADKHLKATYRCLVTADGEDYLSTEAVLLPDAASILGADITDSGYCGDEVTWAINGEGVLAIEGTGDMRDFEAGKAPWNGKGVRRAFVSAGVTGIGANAFAGCRNLKTVSIAGSVERIGNSAFTGCARLAEATVPAAVFAMQLFADCEELETVVVCGEGDMRDNAYSLSPNTALKNAVILSGVTDIGAYAFHACAALENVIVPDTVTRIGFCAFMDCTGLVSIDLPEGLTAIEQGAFMSCAVLGGIRIPNGVTEIADRAFYNCEALMHAYVPASVLTIGENVFGESCRVFCESAQREAGWDNSFVTYQTDYTRDRYIYEVEGAVFDVLPAPVITVNGTDRGYAKIKWKAIRGAVSYDIYYGTAENGPYRLLKNVTRSSFASSKGGVGTVYWYRVQALARNPEFNSEMSEPQSHKLGTRPVQKPELAVSVTSKGYAKFKWKPVKDAGGYAVYRAEEKNGPYELIKKVNGTTFTDSKGVPGATFWYKAVSLTLIGTEMGEYSEPVSFTFAFAPTLKVKKTSAGYAKVTWKALEGAASYAVYRCRTKDGEYAQVRLTEGTSYTYKKGKAGNTYWFRVVALAQDGTEMSEYSLPVSFMFPPVPVIKVTVAKTGVRLRWKAIDGAEEYAVYRAESEDGEYTLVRTTDATSYNDKKGVPGYTYWYKAVALAEDGRECSGYSKVVSFTFPTAAPEVKVSANDDGNARLRWKAVEGAASYAVYRSKAEDGEYAQLKTTTRTSYTNSSGKSGSTYWYEVVVLAEDGSEMSPYSEPVSFTFGLEPIVLEVASNDSNCAYLTWKAVPGAEAYAVYRLKKGGTEYKLLKTVSRTSYTNTSGKEGVTYFYKVIAVAGGEEIGDTESNVVTFTF